MKPIVRIEVETLPDKEGKQRFVADWRGPSKERRGQYFRTNLAEALKHWRDRGYTVDVSYLPEVKP